MQLAILCACLLCYEGPSNGLLLLLLLLFTIGVRESQSASAASITSYFGCLRKDDWHQCFVIVGGLTCKAAGL